MQRRSHFTEVLVTRNFSSNGPLAPGWLRDCGAWLVWLRVWLPATAPGLRLATVGGLPTPWYRGSTGAKNTHRFSLNLAICLLGGTIITNCMSDHTT
jgi:hypothetical protein